MPLDNEDRNWIEGKLNSAENKISGLHEKVNGVDRAMREKLAQHSEESSTARAKLQMQADFLDQHTDCAMCFNPGWVLDGEGHRRPSSHPTHARFYGLEDILVRNPAWASATMFRRGLFGEFPDWFRGDVIGDWALHVMNARHGRIGYLPERVAVRRELTDSVSGEDSGLRLCEQGVNTTVQLRDYLGKRYDRYLDCAASFYYSAMAMIHSRLARTELARNCMRQAVRHVRADARMPWMALARALAMVYVPGVARVWRRAKSWTRPRREAAGRV